MTTYSSSMWLHAPHLRATHGFSTRRGGVSSGPYASLNLDDREDRADDVEENRRRALGALGLGAARVARLDQVHGTDVVRGRVGVQRADGVVTDEPGLVLTIMTADCYPVLLEDAEAGVVGAAHAGWRGTLGRVAARTVEAMTALGARPERIRAAVGPGIAAARYAVGVDVARQFEEGGLGLAVRDVDGAPHLDLLAANVRVLAEAGVPEDAVWTAGLCSTEDAFFSYRRDAGRTGRMWAAIAWPEDFHLKRTATEVQLREAKMMTGFRNLEES
ncbi:peptidoglycan editing factor PgeF [Deinococcus pimensis]|uniref:peptidoglycan editing factor PgeF n=1 Tax=Deinococcus pimensis TaxID=309888 RepID=UPI0004B6692D|nr:peptidoglycan editing factor PgeF [Deinococcus pimensis]